jgi:DNA-binding NtrC family response regulator
METADIKLLVAEDDPQLRRQFEYVLSDAGYSVETVPTGEAAREALTSSHFDIVVTDIQMGGAVSGVSIAGRAILDYPETKVVVVTGMVGIASSAVGRSGMPGAHATLFKPVAPEKLVSTVAAVLAK